MKLERVNDPGIIKAKHIPNIKPNRRMLQSDLSKMPSWAKPIGAVKTVAVPICMRCYLCEEDYKFTKKVDMYICSNQQQAEYGKGVMWKCPKCQMVRTEKFNSPEEAVSFYLYCNQKGWVLHDDGIYKRNNRRPAMQVKLWKGGKTWQMKKKHR